MVESAETLQNDLAKRNEAFKKHNIAPATIRKAWFISAHLLLQDNAKIVDMGCGDGEITFCMAMLNPNLHFTGLDTNKKNIARARMRFETDNLDFKVGDATSRIFPKNSMDAVIHNFTLHEIYSDHDYNNLTLEQTLKNHHEILKNGGQIFVQDYACPRNDDFVILELENTDSTGNTLTELSDPDLLMWFAENARTKDSPGFGGFLLEELPAKTKKNRLFRLPARWANEFILRQNNRALWERECQIEYTAFTQDHVDQQLKRLGMRCHYAAPFYEEAIEEKTPARNYRLLDDKKKELPRSPISFIALASKHADRESLNVQERRIVQKKDTDNQKNLEITSMRNTRTGALVDIVKPQQDNADILPYFITESGRLKVILHANMLRPVTQTITRQGTDISEQNRSGHMIEAIKIPTHILPAIDDISISTSAALMNTHIGLEPAYRATLKPGSSYYPSPDFIDTKTQTFYIQAKPLQTTITPKSTIAGSHNLHEKGELSACDAQHILDAIAVGLIPNAHLETQILELFKFLDIRSENWTKKHIRLKERRIKNDRSLNAIIGNLGLDKGRFKDIKTNSNILRAVTSTFVEEGQDKGSITGLSHEDKEFIIHTKETENIAVIIPLSRNIKAEVHVALMIDQFPALQRQEGNGTTLSVPRIPLPPQIEHIDEAKAFLAKQYGVTPDNIITMGAPYFTENNITPQRIYPFAVALAPDAPDPPGSVFVPFYHLMVLNKSMARDPHMGTLIGRSFRLFHDDFKHDVKASAKVMANQKFKYNIPEFALPLDYDRAPSLPPEKTLKAEELGRSMQAATSAVEPAAKASKLTSFFLGKKTSTDKDFPAKVVKIAKDLDDPSPP